MKKPVKAEIITIGDEILYGHITDTNTRWISSELSAIGVSILRKNSVGDSSEEIRSALKEASDRADIIITTGGLGPTKDDITKHTLSEYFNTPLKLNEEALKQIRFYLQSTNRNLSQLNQEQAMLPENSTYLPNNYGTAPGMMFEKAGKVFFSLPGVPYEMEELVNNEVIPQIKSRFELPVIYHKLIKTAGIPEARLSELLSDWEKSLPSNIKPAYLPGRGIVNLRLTAKGSDIKELQEQTEKQVKQLAKIIPDNIFGYDGDVLEEVIGKMLRKKGMTISTAESCTGGYIGYRITTIPGSSDYYNGSITAYKNNIKEEILGVSSSTLEKHGAVSEQTAKEMAEGVRKVMNTDIGISSTGIAGPTGGTPEKPVGTVWIACSYNNDIITKKLMLTNQRELNIRLTTINIFNLLRQQLRKKDAEKV